MQKQHTPKRRGRGRPPVCRQPRGTQKDGIVETPSDAQNRMEFVYHDPMVFKSLFTYFKNLKTVDIHIRCAPDGLTFFTRGKYQASRVVAHLPGKEMDHYYCDAQFWLGLNRDRVERLFWSIDKSFSKITLLIRHDDPDTLNIIFKDPTIDKECNYHVALSTLEPDEDLISAEKVTTSAAIKAAFPIEFTLTSKQFKKTITDAGHYSSTLSFEKFGSEPLLLKYDRAGIGYQEIYRDGSKICQRSDIAEGTLFQCALHVETVKALAAAMVTATVRIFCREDKDILFQSKIAALSMSTLTQLA